MNMRRALEEQRFRTEVSLVVDYFQLAQDLMLILGTDVHVKFGKSRQKKGLEYWIEVDDGLSKDWNRIIHLPRYLVATHSISFRDELELATDPGTLDIRFLSGGTVMSRGVFRLSSHQNPALPAAINRAICLHGYPHPIMSVLDDRKGSPCLEQEEFNFDEKLTKEMMMEVKKEEKKEVEQEVKKEVKQDVFKNIFQTEKK